MSYKRLAGPWGRIATLVLEAAYEATLLAARVDASGGRSPVVFLTRLGGGAFGNDDRWIDGAMRRALQLADGWGLDVRVVSYGAPTAGLKALVGEFSPVPKLRLGI